MPKLMANQKAAAAQTTQNKESKTTVIKRRGSRPRTMRIQSYTNPRPAPSSRANAISTACPSNDTAISAEKPRPKAAGRSRVFIDHAVNLALDR